jgi:hypothetical protein
LVDNRYAAIGGLDLCFGRWDTHTHPLADVHPTDFSRTLFPGQDYNNARIMDFKDVYDYVSNTLSILDNARMPWHDVCLHYFPRVFAAYTSWLTGSYDIRGSSCIGYFPAFHRTLE